MYENPCVTPILVLQGLRSFAKKLRVQFHMQLAVAQLNRCTAAFLHFCFSDGWKMQMTSGRNPRFYILCLLLVDGAADFQPAQGCTKHSNSVTSRSFSNVNNSGPQFSSLFWLSFYVKRSDCFKVFLIFDSFRTSSWQTLQNNHMSLF